jgi:uncharacterized protein (DUF1015 family)
MAAVTCVDDPGLALLPIHRLVRPPAPQPDLARELERFFRIEDAASMPDLLNRLAATPASTPAFGALGLEESKFRLLTLRDEEAARTLMPERSEVWRGLDVSVLEYAVLREILGIDATATQSLDYTEDAARAHREVESGRWTLAFLLNPTRVDQILAVADAGERMPPKSTFFFPKLATGVVLNPFE